MARKKKGCDCEPGLPGWMATFSDMMTLLLTFFVLLLSMSSLDQQKLKEALGSLRGSLGVLEGGTKTEYNVQELIPSLEFVPVSPRKLAEEKFNRIRREIFKAGMNRKVRADRTEEGILLQVDNRILFGKGKATIEPGAFATLHAIAGILRGHGGDIRIEGHTDNIPIHTKRYPSNWELSTTRAVNVLRYLIEKEKMDPTKFSAVGYGETRPVFSNATPEGRAGNRRVTFVLIDPKVRATGTLKENRHRKGSLRPAKRKKPGFHFSFNLRKEQQHSRGEE